MSKLRVERVQSGYDKHVVVKDVNLEVPEGKITVLIGPNGCGKSTLLKTVARFMEPMSGTILLDEENIHKMQTKALSQKLSILPQNVSAPEGITVKDLVSYGRHPHQKMFAKPSDEDKEVIDWAIDSTNLSEFRDCEVSKLSGGQSQRAWIALTLAQQSKTILLDEPTTFLDMAYQLEVLQLLKEINEKFKTTIVIVLHDINLSARFADYMVAMKDGQIVASGSPDEVVTSEHLKTIYEIDANIISDDVHNCPVCMSYELLKG